MPAPRDAFRHRVHVDVRDRDGHSATLEVAPRFRVGRVDHHPIEKSMVDLGDAERRDRMARGAQHAAERTADGPSSRDRADRHERSSAIAERPRDARHAEDRPDAGEGIARRQQQRVGSADRLNHTGRRLRLCEASIREASDRVACAAADEVFLKREPSPTAGMHDRAHRVVRHRQYLRFHSEGGGDLRRHLVKRAPGGKSMRTMNVRGQVEIAEPEPARTIEAPQRSERARRIAGDTPAALPRRDPCQVVDHRVEVGGDVQPVEPLVVGGIHDDREVPSRYEPGDAAQQARRADPPG